VLKILRGEDKLLKFDLRNKFKIDSKDDGKNPEDGSFKGESEKFTADSLKKEMIASILKGGVKGEQDKTVTFADLNAIDEELSTKNNDKPGTSIEQKTRHEENIESTIEEKLVAKVEEKLKAKLEEKLVSRVETQQKLTMLDMEEFTLDSGQHLTCVIYNDDDADAGEIGGGPGVVFHFETIMIKLSLAGGGPADCISTVSVAPCIEIIDEKNFIVRPDLSMAPQDLTPTTLILLTVVPSSDFNLATQCTVTGLNVDGVGDIDGFGVRCLDTALGLDPSNDYNFNLALIETTMQ